MKIKKFEGKTEKAAIEAVRDEFGAEALVLSIKNLKRRGIFWFLKKPRIEVTAAVEERPETGDRKPETGDRRAAASPQRVAEKPDEIKRMEAALKDATIQKQEERIDELSSLLVSQEQLLRGVELRLAAGNYDYPPARRFANNILQTFYDQLVRQGVTPAIAEEILSEAAGDDDSIDVELVVNVVYGAIVKIVGDAGRIGAAYDGDGDGGVAVAAFIGPTGVGKTTTIAKLSADFILNERRRVGLITADTYRIAAVEQLKTYADILGVDVGVVYNKSDLLDYVELMRVPEDIILIDTAGRSHRNTDNMEELRDLIDSLPVCELYLVLSLTTKYEDMLDIVNTYAKHFDFKIIFTKLDETLSLGSVLNLCFDTRKRISYITFGQNVPEDIRPLNAEDVARGILGGNIAGGVSAGSDAVHSGGPSSKTAEGGGV